MIKGEQLPMPRAAKAFLPWRVFLNEEGSQLIELAVVLPLLLIIFAGAVDFGRAYFLYMEVSSAAEAGALYGAQHPTDTAGMASAALLDAPDLPNLISTATYGSECSDGTSAVGQSGPAPSCNGNAVQYIEVDTSATYQPLLFLPGNQSLFTLSGKSRIRASF
jgi:Flp pilus assembly protein TadG